MAGFGAVRRRGELAQMCRTEPLSPPSGVPDPASPCDTPTMTNLRAVKTRKSRRTRQAAGSAPEAHLAAVLDPLAPPDTFAPLATERLILRPLIPEDAE